MNLQKKSSLEKLMKRSSNTDFLTKRESKKSFLNQNYDYSDPIPINKAYDIKIHGDSNNNIKYNTIISNDDHDNMKNSNNILKSIVFKNQNDSGEDANHKNISNSSYEYTELSIDDSEMNNLEQQITSETFEIGSISSDSNTKESEKKIYDNFSIYGSSPHIENKYKLRYLNYGKERNFIYRGSIIKNLQNEEIKKHVDKPLSTNRKWFIFKSFCTDMKMDYCSKCQRIETINDSKSNKIII